MELLIKTLAGLENLLAAEIEAIGGQEIETLKRALRCRGDLRLLYRANLELRTALRVLTPIDRFRVRHEDELYKKVRRIDWSQYIGLDDTLAVDSFVHSQKIKHSKFAALRVKDGIVDRFRRDFGRRPNVDTQNPSLRINLHLADEQCTLSLDSSGDSLHKRGYRQKAVAAPLNEVLAAGMILLSGWRGERPFLDPMCGSGTLLIEAALLAANIPPQIRRSRFGFKQWKNFDQSLWQEILSEAEAAGRSLPHPILGCDRDARAVEICRRNIRNVGLEDLIQVKQEAFEKLAAPGAEGLLMTNPPYDERLVQQDIRKLYAAIGDQLKQQFTGWDAWMLSANKEALKALGLRPSRKLTLFNGALECKFQHFELYAGSRKKSGANVK